MSRLVCCLSLGLSLASFTQVTFAEPRKPTHIACVGDSITAGSGATAPAKNYPSQLQVLLGNGVTVKNFGNSGSTMLTEGYGDKPWVKQAEYTAATDFVKNAGADAVVSVIIILGANDSKPQNWDPTGKPKNDQQYLKDYRALVDHFAALPTQPTVYIGYPLATGNGPCCGIRGNVIKDEEIPLIAQVATEKRLPIIDLNTPTQGHPEYFGDGVHPNDAGYAVMAKLVQAGLSREPKVTLTSPMPDASFGLGTMVPLTADAGDSTVDFSSVEFFEGTTSLGKVSAKPFTLAWATPVGTHTITAKATDTTLATGESVAVTFTVANSTGGGAGGGGAGGSGAAGAAGSASGGGTGGSASGGADSGAATGGAAGAMASAGTGGGRPLGTTTTQEDSGCSFGGGSSAARGGALLLAGLLLRRRRFSRAS
jgi:lysophospholipase L1-like esterase